MQCARCGTINRAGAGVCAGCGSSSAAAAPAPPPAPQPWALVGQPAPAATPTAPPPYAPPQPQYAPPQYGQPQYAPPAGSWQQPPGPAWPGPTTVPQRTRRRGLWIGLTIATVLVLVLVGIGVAAVDGFLSSDTDAVAAMKGEWEPVTSTSGGYHLEMPEGASHHHLPIDDGPSVEVIYAGDGSFEVANVGLMFYEQELSSVADAASLRESFDALLEGTADGMATGAGGRTTGVNRLDEFRLGPAGRFTGVVERPGYAIEGHVVLHGTRLLAVIAIVPDDELELATTAVDRAIASLETQ